MLLLDSSSGEGMSEEKKKRRVYPREIALFLRKDEIILSIILLFLGKIDKNISLYIYIDSLWA